MIEVKNLIHGFENYFMIIIIYGNGKEIVEIDHEIVSEIEKEKV